LARHDLIHRVTGDKPDEEEDAYGEAEKVQG
jgi:hypothetical protein